MGEGSYTMVRTKTPNILSGQEYRGFWITIKGGYYSFGKEGEVSSNTFSERIGYSVCISPFCYLFDLVK